MNSSILITGASAGIGRALAFALAPEGAKLTLAARNAERLEAVAQECERLGAETLVVTADVTQSEACRQLIERSIERFGRLDVLVNNAGRAMWSRFDQLDDLSVIEDVMRLNYLASVYCTYFALPHLKQSRGLVVALASVAGLTGVPLLSGYSASKHAVIGFFESLRIELEASGVDVTIIAPDWVQSEILERSLDRSAQPLGHSPMDQSQLMSTERCAARIQRAIAGRERLVLTSGRSKNMRWGKLLMPRLVDRMIAAAMGIGKKS